MDRGPTHLNRAFQLFRSFWCVSSFGILSQLTMFNVVFGKGRHGERRRQGLVWSWTLGLLALGPVLQYYILHFHNRRGCVQWEEQSPEDTSTIESDNYIKCSHKLFSCRFNVYPLYPGTNFFFRKTRSLHAPKGFQISFQLKAENLEVWLKISNVHIDAFFFSFNLKIYIVLQSYLGEQLTIRRIISLALIYLCTFSKLLCLESSKTDVFNK